MIVGHAHEPLVLPGEDVARLVLSFVLNHAIISVSSVPHSLLKILLNF